MRGFSFHNVFRACDVSAFHRATALIKALRDPASDAAPFRCHEVTRAIARMLVAESIVPEQLVMPVDLVVDGTYCGVEHSWLRLSEHTLLDCYAVARLPMVQLVDIGTPTLQRDQYRRGPKRDDIRKDIEDAIVREIIAWAQHGEELREWRR